MLQITQQCLELFKQDALTQLPNEACGILAGQGNTINHYTPMTNIDESPEHFTFDMSEAFKAQKALRKLGLQYLATIHSHPETPARPSIEDISLANDSSKFYLILSLIDNGGDCQAYKIFHNGNDQHKTVEHIPLTIIS